MFISTHQALTFAYRVTETPIMPINNTASVLRYIEEKGVVGLGGQSTLSAHDIHAQAAVIIGKVEDNLVDYPLLLAAIRCQYGRGGKDWHHGTAVLDAHYRDKYNDPKCDAYGYVVRSIFMSRPNKEDLVQGRMLDAFGWSLRTWQYRKSEVRKDMGKFINDAICQLEPVFYDSELIQKDVA